MLPGSGYEFVGDGGIGKKNIDKCQIVVSRSTSANASHVTSRIEPQTFKIEAL